MAKEIGKFNCTFENCLTDADGSLVLSLRVAKDETYPAKQTAATIRTGLQKAKNGSQWRSSGTKKSGA